MKFLVGFLFVGCCWLIIFFYQMGNPTKLSQWIYDAYNKKTNIANSIKDKKIVILAGSNALFGVDSHMISKEFNLPVVNMGVNAGIELPLVLELTKRVIKKGDIVIAPLEYPMYSYTGKAGVQMIDYLLSREPKFFWRLSLKEMIYIITHVGFKRLYNGLFYKGGKPITSGLYGIHHIEDKHGDQNQTDVRYRTNWMYGQIVNKYAKHPERYGKEFDRDALGWKYIDKFVKWCKKRDVKVIFMPSTILKCKSYFDDEEERWFYTHIGDEVRKRGWLYIGEPYKYMYDKECYFDTNFHLVNSCRKKRTKQMIKDLKSFLP